LSNTKQEHLYPIIAHHSSWKSYLFPQRVKNFVNPNFNRNPYFGYEATSRRLSESPGEYPYNPDDFIPSDVIKVPSYSIDILQNIVDTCQKNDIHLVFAVAPTIHLVNHPDIEPAKDILGMVEKLSDFIEENDIPLYNYILLSDEIDLTTYDFFEPSHLNTDGATKVSQHFANVLKNDFPELLSDCIWDYKAESQSEYEKLLNQ